ncbi:hypothetical protein [Curtobacterium herbarum]|uniref:DUF3180 domain-containing protein n=1 Tax=Curtobacterium herbarum TaxID=150122 RepID=A0ABN1Z8R3_9MICO|nr:hypothetical protein [Curtobacterium herbarum]MBM7476390.1 hypothetical protein [Curtobacterium herbarum]MCS6544045.1 hypothetical protein [Curtobacterium herbarum]
MSRASRPDDWDDVPALSFDDRRWDVVEQRSAVLSGGDEPGVADHGRRRLRVRLVTAAALVVLAGAVGVWSAVQTTVPSREPSDTQLLIGSVLLALGLVVWGIGGARVVRAGRAHSWRAMWSDPLSGLSMRERRGVERVLRGRAPAEPHRVRVLRRLAKVRLVQSEWAVWFTAGWVPLAAGQSLAASDDLMLWVEGVLALVFGAMFLVVTTQREQWRAFLDRTA